MRPPNECTSLVQNSRSRAVIKAGTEEALGPTERAHVDEPVVMVFVVVALWVIAMLGPIRQLGLLRLRREEVEYSKQKKRYAPRINPGICRSCCTHV